MHAQSFTVAEMSVENLMRAEQRFTSYFSCSAAMSADQAQAAASLGSRKASRSTQAPQAAVNDDFIICRVVHLQIQ
jgi:hypothetical protein